MVITVQVKYVELFLPAVTDLGGVSNTSKLVVDIRNQNVGYICTNTINHPEKSKNINDFRYSNVFILIKQQKSFPPFCRIHLECSRKLAASKDKNKVCEPCYFDWNYMRIAQFRLFQDMLICSVSVVYCVDRTCFELFFSSIVLYISRWRRWIYINIYIKAIYLSISIYLSSTYHLSICLSSK